GRPVGKILGAAGASRHRPHHAQVPVSGPVWSAARAARRGRGGGGALSAALAAPLPRNGSPGHCTPPAGQRLAAAPPAAQVAQLYWLAVRRARSLDQACPAPRSGADGPPALRRNRELV